MPALSTLEIVQGVSLIALLLITGFILVSLVGLRRSARPAPSDAAERWEAERWQADLVVVGSHGHSGLRHLTLGSVSEAVVRHAPCSVELVRCPISAA